MCSGLLGLGEMQNKSIINYQCKPKGWLRLKRVTNTNCWQGCEVPAVSKPLEECTSTTTL